MNIMGAWKRGFTGKNVVVTILDDGIERNHPDLLQNYVSVYVCMWAGYERECVSFVALQTVIIDICVYVVVSYYRHS